METRRIYSAIVGLAQSVMGVLAGASGVLFGFDIVDIQELLSVPLELKPINLLILGLFSVFSIISGFFLIRDWQK